MAPFALLSVSDKNRLVPLAEALHRTHGYQLLSSGGTAKVLEQAGLPVTRVSDHTGAPEILGGRVKTLHPKVHGGILARRGDSAHQADLEQQGIPLIDLVVVNLYPFRETIARPDVSWDQAIEQIDIGGAAAKNRDSGAHKPRPMTGCWLTSCQVPADLRRQLGLRPSNTPPPRRCHQPLDGQSSGAGGQPWLEAVPDAALWGKPHQKARWFSHPKQLQQVNLLIWRPRHGSGAARPGP